MSFLTDGRLELEWHPAEADLLEVRVAARSARYLRSVLGCVGLGLVVTAAGLLRGAPALVALGSAVVAVPVGLRVLGGLLTRRAFRRTPALQLPVRATVDVRDGVTVQSGGTSAQWHWGAIVGMVETPRTFLLPVAERGGRQYVLLAKRGLREQHVGLLRAMLADRVA